MEWDFRAKGLGLMFQGLGFKEICGLASRILMGNAALGFRILVLDMGRFIMVSASGGGGLKRVRKKYFAHARKKTFHSSTQVYFGYPNAPQI